MEAPKVHTCDMMSKKCIVCGKSPKKMTANPAYPNKYICLECLNGFMVNMTTLEEELIHSRTRWQRARRR